MFTNTHIHIHLKFISGQMPIKIPVLAHGSKHIAYVMCLVAPAKVQIPVGLGRGLILRLNFIVDFSMLICCVLHLSK